MKGWLELLRRGSIFRYSFALALGGAVTLALATAFFVVLTPVPFEIPYSSFEVARLLNGQPAPLREPGYRVRSKAEAPNSEASTDPVSEVIRDAIARQLGVGRDRIFFEFRPTIVSRSDPPLNLARHEYERFLMRSAGAYRGDPRFSPLIFGSFEAGLHGDDGRWRIVSHIGAGPGPIWQASILNWLAISMIVLIPIAWLSSLGLARPIEAFSAAASRIGQGSFETVSVSGPVEIRRAAEALNAMQARIERNYTERIAMIGAIAHDLRTPLARLSFVAESADEPLRARLALEVGAMERMIASTLDFVQSESAPRGRDRIDLRLLVEGVVDDFVDMGKDVRLEPGSSAVLVGDPELLRRLFTNLIGNAVAYAGAAEVQIEVGDAWANVEVADRGPGMSASDLERAFEPFFRAEPSRNRDTGGVGLGLAIVRSIARLHGGRVTLSNRAGGGLSAVVGLPV